MNIPSEQSLLRVAFPSNGTAQQTSVSDATGNATCVQLNANKPASVLDLARNKLRNSRATSAGKDAQLDAQDKGVGVAHSKLTSLVRFCGEAYGFTDEDHAEALPGALADYDSALICFRAIKAQILADAGGHTFVGGNK